MAGLFPKWWRCCSCSGCSIIPVRPLRSGITDPSYSRAAAGEPYLDWEAFRKLPIVRPSRAVIGASRSRRGYCCGGRCPFAGRCSHGAQLARRGELPCRWLTLRIGSIRLRFATMNFENKLNFGRKVFGQRPKPARQRRALLGMSACSTVNPVLAGPQFHL